MVWDRVWENIIIRKVACNKPDTFLKRTKEDLRTA